VISFALMLAGWWLLYLRSPQPPADEYDALLPDGGFGATGYPGTVFPGGSPWGPAYGPYTKLPDQYEPDPAKDTAAGRISPRGTATEVIAPETGDTAARHHETSTQDTSVLRAPMDAPVDKQDSPGTTIGDAGNSDSADDGTAAAGTGAPSNGSPEYDRTGMAAEFRAPAGNASDSNTSTPGNAGGNADSAATQRVTPPSSPFRSAPNSDDIRPTASGWDPLGVSPLIWDLPDPTPDVPTPPMPMRRPRSRLTPVVIGLAILAAAAAGAVAASGADWMTPGRIGAVALAVVGLGLIVGAFARRGYGLMVLLAPLAGFVILASLIGPVRFDRAAMGNHTWTPATVAELAHDYRVDMGNGTLDLRSLNLTENRTVNVHVRAGNLRVLVPKSMRLDAKCRAAMGNTTCPQGLSGPATGPVLTLDVHVRAGDAEVTRG
jgi:hypothetical protein